MAEYYSPSAHLICRALTGQAEPALLRRLPHPWSVLGAAFLVAPRSKGGYLIAARAALRALTDEDLAQLQRGFIGVYLNALKVPLTRRQRQLLAAALYLAPARLGPIARLAGQDRGNAHRRLQSLVRRGLLQRTYRDEAVYYQTPHAK